MAHKCMICRKPMPDNYKPEMCCNGQMCACRGVPIEPIVCSDECWNAIMDNIGLPFDERRKKAGIKLYEREENGHEQNR